MYKLFLSLAIIIGLSGTITGQTGLLEKDRSLPCLARDFTVMAHMVRDTFGQLGVVEEDIELAISVLNSWFAPICVSFTLARTEIIDNFQYSEPFNYNEWEQMWVNHNYDNRINLYIVNDVSRLTYECVFADQEGILNLTGSGVMIQKNCLLNEPVQLVHAFGHYCGLFNTNEEPGTELVDESNCSTAGDLICDTPADPYDPTNESHKINEFINEDCRFIYSELDPNDHYYIPQTGNVMSNYPSFCWCGFTQDQFFRMAAVIEQSAMW